MGTDKEVLSKKESSELGRIGNVDPWDMDIKNVIAHAHQHNAGAKGTEDSDANQHI